MGRILLDPNAASYTDDEIVGKMNAATAKVTRIDAIEDAALQESANFKKFTGTEQTKLTGIEDSAKDDQSGAEIKAAYEAEENAYTDTKNTKLTGIEENAKADQTGDEIVAAIDAGTNPITREGALSQSDLKLVKSAPQSGERAVTSISVDASDKLAADHSDTPEP